MFEAFPNAARVAFTGTPLITERHGSKQTVKRFGEYIDTYKLMDSVEDGATLQILYEGRTANTALRDKAEFDTAFEDLFADRSAEDMLALKKKYGATGDILEAENRIEPPSGGFVFSAVSDQRCWDDMSVEQSFVQACGCFSCSIHTKNEVNATAVTMIFFKV